MISGNGLASFGQLGLSNDPNKISESRTEIDDQKYKLHYSEVWLLFDSKLIRSVKKHSYVLKKLNASLHFYESEVNMQNRILENHKIERH